MINFQHSFFESIAKKYPKYIAIDDHGKKMNYKSLNSFSNQISNLLLKNNCKPNDRVIVFTEKNSNMYGSILGVLKSGACWVPLSSFFPKKRIIDLIKSIKPKMIITDKKNFLSVKSFNNKKVIIIDEKYKKKNYLTFKNINSQKKTKTNPKNLCSTDLAYIIFTSGSTGKPKGVMVTHENTCNYLKYSNLYFKPKKKLRFAHIAELTFDVSIFDIFICFLNAGTIIPFNKKSYRISPSNFFKNNKNINVMFTVPSFLQQLLDSKDISLKKLNSLKHVVLGGEAIPKNLLKKPMQLLTKTNFYNVYGTTETAIITHWHKIKKNELDNIPIGNLLPNIKLHLVNNDKVHSNKGEAYFSGPQIFKGYLDNDYLTKKSLVDSPNKEIVFNKFYKCGDRLYKDKNELYFFKGRVDTQVKIRGHRLEVEEINELIIKLNGVEEIYTYPFVRRKKSNNLELFTFIKSSDQQLVNKSYKLIDTYLPPYFKPSKIFIIKDFKRTYNGKIDKKFLEKIILQNYL